MSEFSINPKDIKRSEIHKKIHQALLVSDGDMKQASREIVELCLRDHAFLLGLTEPFLRGIIGHSLKTVSDKMDQSSPAVTEDDDTPENPPAKLDLDDLSKQTGLGADIVRTALGSEGHRFGTADRTRGSLGKRKKASNKHVDALQQIAQTQRDRKKED